MRPAARGSRDLAGPASFVVVALALTWATAAWIGPAWAADEPAVTRLLRASVLYTLVVGWQPLLAVIIARRVADDERALDRGLRALKGRYTWIALVLPIALIGGAAIFNAKILSTVQRSQHFVFGWSEATCAVLAFGGVLAVLWLQAIVEEVAWRGYLLPRLMRRFGPWTGLVLHGILWGACYTPVFLVSEATSSLSRMASFVVTCGLLGVLLGWVRLASGSVFGSAASNATLTICAGLPLVFQGGTSSLSAVFEPAGWLPMLLLIALIAMRTTLRSAIAVPERRLPDHLN